MVERSSHLQLEEQRGKNEEREIAFAEKRRMQRLKHEHIHRVLFDTILQLCGFKSLGVFLEETIISIKKQNVSILSYRTIMTWKVKMLTVSASLRENSVSPQ